MPQTDPTSRAILRLGASLSARYAVVRLLGIGARAAVYEGRSRDGRRVAIKVFAPELSRDPAVARALRQAIRRAGDVGHPGIVHPIDEGEAADGALFVVTPLLRGQTLRERADRAGGPLPITEVIAVADGALSALAAAHTKGLVHGDVKPTNVFRTSDRETRILDFGLGLGADRAFVAPERRTAGAPPIDPRDDVWGLGATLFFLLTGRPPTDADGADEGSTARTLAGVTGSSGIAEVVGRALATDPSARWAHAAETHEAMRSLCASALGERGAPLSARPPAPADGDRRVSVAGTELPGADSVGGEESSPTACTGATRFESRETDEPSRPCHPCHSSRRGDASEVARARVGALLDGKYRLEQLLGEGGTAAVYRAVHRNGHRVAVKILHARIAVEPHVRDRFLREGYVVNKIDHPGVVRMADDCVLADGTAFLVMELLSGESLDAHVERRGGALSTPEVVRLSLQLLDVLSAAHRAGVVHRDIKPGNLFLTTDGKLRVLDFGIARAEDPAAPSHTRTGAVMGTPAFMAPEQALGQTGEVDAQTDIWAVGATMVRLLTGEYVHAAPTAEAMRVYAGSRAPRSIATIAPGIDARLAAIVDKALAPEKAARWPAAAAMRDALASLGAAASLAPSAMGTWDARVPTSDEGDASTEAVVAASRRALAAKQARPPFLALAFTGVLLGAGALFAAQWRPAGVSARPAEPSASAAAAALVPLQARPERSTPASASAPVAAAFAPAGVTGAAVAPGAELVDSVTRGPRARSVARATSRAQTPAALAPARMTAVAATSGVQGTPDPCAPPYVTDSVGRRAYKPQCFPDSQVVPVTPPPASRRCDPPYVVDSTGRHVYKPECLD